MTDRCQEAAAACWQRWSSPPSSGLRTFGRIAYTSHAHAAKPRMCTAVSHLCLTQRRLLPQGMRKGQPSFHWKVHLGQRKNRVAGSSAERVWISMKEASPWLHFGQVTATNPQSCVRRGDLSEHCTAGSLPRQICDGLQEDQYTL